MRTALIAIVVLLSACAPVTSTSDPPSRVTDSSGVAAQQGRKPDPNSRGPDTCGRSRFANLIGRPASSIDRSRLPANARIVCYSCPVTMEMSPDRLNILLDQRGDVSELRCG